MNTKVVAERLAVCSWSLQPKNPAGPAGKIGRLRPFAACNWPWIRCANRRRFGARPNRFFAKTKSASSQECFGCVGEDYSSLQTIRLTGGLAPDATWEQNRKNIQDTVRAGGKARIEFGHVSRRLPSAPRNGPRLREDAAPARRGCRPVRRRRHLFGPGDRTGNRARAGRAAAKAATVRTWA